MEIKIEETKTEATNLSILEESKSALIWCLKKGLNSMSIRDVLTHSKNILEITQAISELDNLITTELYAATTQK